MIHMHEEKEVVVGKWLRIVKKKGKFDPLPSERVQRGGRGKKRESREERRTIERFTMFSDVEGSGF
jgi:hypothetical protein